jgi:hypothetical protein
LSFKYSLTCFGQSHAHHLELGNINAVGRGRAGSARPRPTALLSPSSDGKPEATTAVVAPDDGHEDARNMLSCIQMTSNKLEKLLHLVG